MHPMVHQELSRQAQMEARRSGERARHRRQTPRAPRTRAPRTEISIALVEPDDIRSRLELAELDSGRLPHGTLVVARAGGRIRAAIGVDSGSVIADPFALTAELEELLRLRATQIRRERRRRRAVRVLEALRLRPARA
jgi:hypothetical protein